MNAELRLELTTELGMHITQSQEKNWVENVKPSELQNRELILATDNSIRWDAYKIKKHNGAD